MTRLFSAILGVIVVLAGGCIAAGGVAPAWDSFHATPFGVPFAGGGAAESLPNPLAPLVADLLGILQQNVPVMWSYAALVGIGIVVMVAGAAALRRAW